MGRRKICFPSRDNNLLSSKDYVQRDECSLLRLYGYNLRIDVRWGADAAAAQLERYAADLVALGPDVLVSEASTPTAALRSQTRTIPIVFQGVADPAGQGLVASLAHPGGNVTGFTIFDAPMGGKWLEMLTQIKPPATHVTVLYNLTPWSSTALKTIEQAASSLAVPVQAAPVSTNSEIDAAMAQVAREAHGGMRLALAERLSVASSGRLPGDRPNEHLIRCWRACL